MDKHNDPKPAGKLPGILYVGQKHSNIRFKLRLAILGLGCLVVVALVVWGVYRLRQSATQETPVQTTTKSHRNGPADLDKIQAGYDKDIAAMSDKNGRADAYFQKAQVYTLQNNYKDALSAALKSDKLQPNNLRTIETIGDIYAQLGNDQNAALYYQKDIDVFQASSAGTLPGSEATVQYYQQKLDSLGGKS